MSAAASSAAPPPMPCPASAVRRPSTLIFPSPSRTPTHTSSAVRRSAANRAWLGSGPRWLSGAATTKPHEARWRSRLGVAADGLQPVVPERDGGQPQPLARARTRRPAPRPCRGRRAAPRAGPCRRAATPPRARSSPRAVGRTRWWGSQRCTVPPTITVRPSVVGAIAPTRPTCGNDDRHGDDAEETGAALDDLGEPMALRARSIAAPYGRGRPARPAVLGGCSGAELDDADLVDDPARGARAPRRAGRRPALPERPAGRGRRSRCGARSPSTASRSTRSRRSRRSTAAPSPTTCTPRRAPSRRTCSSGRWRRSSQQAGVPAGTASCAGDLPAQVGATVGCTLSGPDGVSTWTVRTTSVDGGKIDYSIEQAGPDMIGIGVGWWRCSRRRAHGGRRSHGVRQGRHGRQRRGADQEPARHRQLGLPDRPEGRAGPVDRLQGDQGRRGLRRQGHRHLRVRRHDQLHDRAGRRHPPRRTTAPPRRPRAAAPTVAGKSVAQSVLAQLAADGKQVDEVSCPDLPATVGASQRCTLKAGADTYGVTVTVTSVQGTDVKFDIQVDQTPTTAPSR